MSHKDSDYTTVNALMCWQNVWLWVLKLTLVVELWAFLSSLLTVIAQVHRFAVH